ncbi:MAG: ABC transporter substrate-binding protein [Candidatus Omnitrophica bacterium]|nr:ABC transporter substrate-binding protein [Candidatus Omnitrophota bacterium]
MKKYLLGIFLATLFLFSVAGISLCLAQDASEFPERIISLGPSITEQLYLLGLKDKVVGVTTYCRDSSEKEKIGTIVEVDEEKIISLKPDLVLAIPLTNPKTVKKLQNLGLRVESFELARDFQELGEQFVLLGVMVGERERAEQIVRQANFEVERIKEKVSHLPKVKVLVQVGANPLFVANKDSFVNDSIEFASGINVATDTRTGLYSREQALQDNPDVILIISMGIEGEQEKEVWQKYTSLKAVEDQRIYIIDDYLYCSPTPQTFVKGLERMVEILHPEDG